MTGNPTSLIDPAQLPVDPATCKPVYPHQYLKVNTIFEVARAAGLRTAWSDKHPAYEILNGPVGHRHPGPVHARDQQRGSDPGLGERLDDRQRADHAVRQLQGARGAQRDRRLRPQRHDQGRHAGDLRDELPDRLDRREAADLERPGRAATSPTASRPGRCWRGRSTTSTRRSAAMRRGDQVRGTCDSSTVIVLSAKHGQSPRDSGGADAHPRRPDHRRAQRRLDGGASRRGRPRGVRDRRRRDADLAARPLGGRDLVRQGLSCSGTPATGNDINGNPKPYTSSGLRAGLRRRRRSRILRRAGRRRARAGRARHRPVRLGVHGQAGQDRRARRRQPAGPRRRRSSSAARRWRTATGRHSVGSPVETTQIAPTILELLGLDPARTAGRAGGTYERATASLTRGGGRLPRRVGRRARGVGLAAETHRPQRSRKASSGGRRSAHRVE